MNNEHGPQGIRGASAPMSAHRIAGIDQRRYSDQERDVLQVISEQDQWNEARNAYAPGNRPVIRRQLNPLMIPAKYRDLPEFWAIYVPRTEVAWNPNQVHYDQHQRMNPAQLKPFGNTENPFPSSEELERLRNTSIKTSEPPAWRLVTEGSAPEAERTAQTLWREYWAGHISKQFQEARKQFQEDAVINVVRQEVFTVDHQDPAHEMQYALFAAQYPEGMPLDVIVHHKNAEISWSPGTLSPSDLQQEIAWEEPQRDGWHLQRTVSADQQESWQVVPLESHRWTIAHLDTDQEWVFWRNGTGRVVALESPEAHKVTGQVPRALNPTVNMNADPQTILDAWNHARQKERFSPEPAVQDWLSAERDLGLQLKAMMAQNPQKEHALRPVLQAVVATHQMIMSPDGIIAGSATQLYQSHERVERAVQQLPPGPDQTALLERSKFWHQHAGALAQDSLGLFRYDRVPDIAFVDPEVMHSPRKDNAGEWIAYPTDSGQMLLGKVGKNNRIQHVDLPVYRNQEAAEIRVKDLGGQLSIERKREVIDKWEASVTRVYGSDAEQWISAVRRPANLAKVANNISRDDAPSQPLSSTSDTLRTQPQRTLYVTPLGGGRGLVWQLPPVNRKEQVPEFVTWNEEQLVPLNKRNREWRTLPKAGDPRPQWEEIGPKAKPWVVELPQTRSLQALCDAVTSRVPEATVVPQTTGPDYLIRALAERYGLEPQPLQSLKETHWTIHPTPQGGAMMSAREWVSEKKPDHPGEYTVYAASIPYLKPGSQGPEIARFATLKAAEDAVDRRGIMHTTTHTMPPEVIDWFAPNLQQKTLNPRPVTWNQQNPLTVLHTASRLVRESALSDLSEADTKNEVPPNVQKMHRQLYAGAARNMTHQDWEHFLPEVPNHTGVAWKEAEQHVASFAKDWLNDRPKLAQRLLKSPEPKGVVPALSL